MKKILMLVFIVAAFQGLTQSSVNFGIKGGVTFTPSSDVGVHHHGVYGRYRFSSYGIQLEVQRSEQLSSVPFGEFLVVYINFPLTFKWYHPKGFYVELGPQLGYLVDADPFSILLNQRDFGSVVGVGWESKFGLEVGLRYYHSLTNHVRFPEFNGLGHYRYFQLSVSYRILKFDK